MIDLNKCIDLIDSRKEEIAKAISLAIADGDKKKAEQYFPCFYESIDETRVFIFQDKEISNGYRKQVNSLIEEINKCIKSNNDQIITYIGDYEKKLLQDKYNKLEKTLKKVDISYETFLDIYRNCGMHQIDKLCRLTKKLKNKIIFYNLKLEFDVVCLSFGFSKLSKDLFEIVDRYDLKSIDELMDFYTGISSYLFEGEFDNKDIELIHRENIEKFICKLDNRDILDNRKELKKLKFSLEKIYENNLMQLFLENTNFKDFFDRYNIAFTEDNFRKVRNNYMYSQKKEIIGFMKVESFDGENHDFIFFPSNIFDEQENYDADTVIIHEFIHTLEGNDGRRPFSSCCVYFNEAIVQWLALQSKKYMTSPIFTKKHISSEELSQETKYDCMLPLVTALKSSCIWEDVLCAKISNDYDFLEERLGKYASKLSDIFNMTYVNNNVSFFNASSNMIMDSLASLNNLLSKIERECPRYNKNLRK